MKLKNYFKDVCLLVEEGFTISQALDELEIDGRTFYKTITKEEKLILGQINTSNKLYGSRELGKGSQETKELHEYFTSEEYAY